MPQYRVRVRLLDRPGALGSVASRIGSVGGDIVAVHILERSDGEAVDEFVVELPGAGLVELLCHEIREVDGVAVESVELLDTEPAGREAAAGAGAPWVGATGSGRTGVEAEA